MTAQPPHQRKLGLCGVALTKVRNSKYDIAALTIVRDEIEALISQTGFLVNAPFSWVSISIRYGLRDENIPHYNKVNKKYGDLPLSIEVDTKKLMNSSIEDVINAFRVAVLKALIHASSKFNLPSDELIKQLRKAEQIDSAIG